MNRQSFQFDISPIQEQCEVVWLCEEAVVEFGEPLLQYRLGEKEIYFNAPCQMTNISFLVKKGDWIGNGSLICKAHGNIYAEEYLQGRIDEQIWDLAIAINAAIKGLLGFMGQSGQIASRTEPIQADLPVYDGLESLIDSIADAVAQFSVEDGDVVVVAEKPFAVAQNRLVPIKYIYETDPKKMNREDRLILLKEIATLINTPVEEEDLILADSWLEDPANKRATMGAYNHNHLAFQVAEKIVEKTNKKVDVIISDTDTGIDIRSTIIGCITIGASPVGATKGLSLYECMRAACAAEFTRGSKKRIPIVICKPAERCRLRPNIGAFRGYQGKLKYKNEGKIAFA